MRGYLDTRVVCATLIVAFAVAACGSSSANSSAGETESTSSGIAQPPVGPFLADANNPTKADTHWHAALGVYNCDHWMSDGSGSGVWAWPYATPAGTPARADNTNVYAGMHSHDDGIIHMEPAEAVDTGMNATVGRYFAYGGWKLSSDGYTFLGATVKDGDTCDGAPGALQWAIGKWDGTGATQTMTVARGDPSQYKLFNDDIVVIAFLPSGKTIDGIGSPPSLRHLGAALGVESPPPAQMPPVTVVPSAP
jgi:hypothetical protein